MPRRSYNNENKTLIITLPNETFYNSSNRKIGKSSSKTKASSSPSAISSLASAYSSSCRSSFSSKIFSPVRRTSKKKITSTFKQIPRLIIIKQSPISSKKVSKKEIVDIYTLDDISDFDLNDAEESLDLTLI